MKTLSSLPVSSLKDYDPPNILNCKSLQQLGDDWQGKLLSPPLEFAVGLSSDYLYFGGRRSAPARCKKDLSKGSFRAELWREDCIELFISATELLPAYYEFNLSPSGLWWGEEFTEYRQVLNRVKCFSKFRPEVYTKSEGSSWESWIKLELTVFLPSGFVLKPKSLRANISAVLSRSEKNQAFLSWAKSSASQPDFHLNSLLLPCSFNSS